MTTTLPIGNVTAAPARATEAARPAQGSSDTDHNAADRSSEATRGGAGFAHALAHAQRPCKPAQDSSHAETGHERRQARSAAASATGPSTRAAQGAGGGREDQAQRLDAAPLQDADADADARGSEKPFGEPREARDDDALACRAHGGSETPCLPAPPALTTDPAALPCAAMAVQRDTAAIATESPTVAAIDSDGTSERPTARRHDHRARTDRQPAAVPAPGDEAAASAPLPLRATPERARSDSTAAATAPAHAPSFDAKAAHDPIAPAWQAAAALRDPGAAATSGAASHLPHASVHAAIDDPGFASALGQQVALWVRDGVQEARLHLHPAELGPVAVQIAIDGQAARVDFTAAVAATRDSIEQSLPALAAALRESGFTLTGGGVSSHAGHDDRSRDASPHRASPADDRVRAAGVTDATAAAGPRRWTRSLLDVYA